METTALKYSSKQARNDTYVVQDDSIIHMMLGALYMREAPKEPINM